jgi:hypothetical protein
MTKSALASGLLVVALMACGISEESLPEVRSQRAPELCLDPLPPPSFVVRRGSDPLRCLPEQERAKRVDVSIVVSADGGAEAVEQTLDLCLTEGPDGTIESTPRLSEIEKRCILGALQDWRFAGVDTCRPVTAHVALSRTTMEARRHSAQECGGGPTKGIWTPPVK